jgi:hypothetical protein
MPHDTPTFSPVVLADDTKLISPSMPSGHKAMIVSTVLDGEASLVTVEVTGGMGGTRIPKPGSIPEIGQRVAYLPDPGWRQTPVFPDRDQIPWTHASATVPDADPSATDDAAAADPSATDDAAAEEWGDDA